MLIRKLQNWKDEIVMLRQRLATLERGNHISTVSMVSSSHNPTTLVSSLSTSTQFIDSSVTDHATSIHSKFQSYTLSTCGKVKKLLMVPSHKQLWKDPSLFNTNMGIPLATPTPSAADNRTKLKLPFLVNVTSTLKLFGYQPRGRTTMSHLHTQGREPCAYTGERTAYTHGEGASAREPSTLK